MPSECKKLKESANKAGPWAWRADEAKILSTCSHACSMHLISFLDLQYLVYRYVHAAPLQHSTYKRPREARKPEGQGEGLFSERRRDRSHSSRPEALANSARTATRARAHTSTHRPHVRPWKPRSLPLALATATACLSSGGSTRRTPHRRSALRSPHTPTPCVFRCKHPTSPRARPITECSEPSAAGVDVRRQVDPPATGRQRAPLRPPTLDEPPPSSQTSSVLLGAGSRCGWGRLSAFGSNSCCSCCPIDADARSTACCCFSRSLSA